ncbi:hypothetical protein B6U80_01255 [Candidatus Pacearchaeota archaeon ex4484_26]|nr:MAG: hypothetical protein B6U80_01255 [Candidatus Pacearchaeota archaeon ex4484_26]
MKDLPISEITLRKYEKPSTQDTRELIKKLCLSLGLLQPGDSRDIVVDILLTLMKASKEKEALNLEEIKKRSQRLRQERNLELRGLADSNIRRQLKKLRDLLIVEKFKNSYQISEFSSLERIFSEKIEKFYLVTIIERIKEYLKELRTES